MELAIDVVFINRKSFLNSADHTLLFNGLVAFGTTEKSESYTSKVLCKGFDDI